MHGGNYRVPNGMPLSKKYAPGTPDIRIARFQTGASNSDYEVNIRLISKEKCQIRDNALEAARVAANKKMNKIVPETSYKLSVKLYPHTVISENRMLATAGADRLQEGMRRAYGKPMGLAARVKIGTVLYEISTYERFTADAKRALKTASSKLPQPTSISIVPIQAKNPSEKLA